MSINEVDKIQINLNIYWKIILFLFCFLFPSLLFSQGEFDNWYFGKHAGLNFSSGTPVVLTNCALSFWEEYNCTTVSDSSGNLWFYALYSAVYNRNNAFMPNGTGLISEGSVTQSNFPIQDLVDDSTYFLFSADAWRLPAQAPYLGLNYSIINMRLNAGFGDIVSGEKNIPVPGAGQTCEMLSGTRHHNNHDAWIVVRECADSNNFLSYLITNTGLDTIPVISPSLIPVNAFNDPPETMVPMMLRISPDGTRLLAMYNGICEFCKFNDTTGVVTPLFRFCHANTSYNQSSAEFSLHSKYLYVSGNYNNHSYIWQYDATKTDSLGFMQSEVLIYGITNSGGSGLQRGPDNRIYCTIPVKDSLSIITKPDIQGTGCTFQIDAINLQSGNLSEYGFPQMLQRYYVYIHHSDPLCSEDSTAFTSSIWPPADSIHWDFGDPVSGSSNFSNLANPSHIYSNVGTYIVELFVKHIDHRTDTTWQTITILDSPHPVLGQDRSICTGDSVMLDAGYWMNSTYIWDNLATSQYGIGNGQTYTAKTFGNYRVTVTNSNGCIGQDTVLVSFMSPPVVTNNPLSKSICSGESTNIVLTSSVPGTNFHWTATLTMGNITGYSADSGLVINQILTNSLSTPGIVTYHITPKKGSCTGTSVDFPVTVNPGDSVKVSISASSNNICAGTSVTFTANPTNQGITPFYQWKVNGINSGTNSTTFIYTPLNGDVVTCVLTSSLTSCISNNPALSNSILMVVNPKLPVSVVVTASQNPVCAGTSVTFTATPTNGGSSPFYQWKVNGTNVGSNSPNYTYTPLNGDLVSCILTSSETCTSNNPASSIKYQVSVSPLLPVSITISPSANPFCVGSPVTFTATPTNGGTTPSYQWKVNGVNAGTDSPNYTYNPANGDMVSCVLTSSIACPITNPITSNTLLMTIINSLPAGVSITASSNPFCPGNSVTFTATPSNGGTNPSYQWKVNGVNVGTNSSTYTYNPANSDSVRCVMTSNLSCVTGNPASSAKIIMSGTLAPIVTFTSCFDTITSVNAKPIKLKGGIPLGGTYSGPGVNSLTGIFTPATAGIGMKTITYMYTNVALCSASKSISIHNLPSSIFSCGSTLTDVRDGKVYSTIQIGFQCWLASNLNFGTVIVSTQDQRDNCVAEKYCYNDNPTNCTNYGGLYQWDELMKFDEMPADQGFCPPGWHIPTENDWNTLFAIYINNAFAGSPLKYSGYSGFNALLSGARYINKAWDFQGFATSFWSSTPRSSTQAWAHGMNEDDPSVSVYPASRVNAFSVRCLKD